MSHLKYWLFRQWLYFLLTQAKLPTNRKSYNGKKNKGVNFSENSPIELHKFDDNTWPCSRIFPWYFKKDDKELACATFNADAFMYTAIQIKCFVLISIEKHMFTSMEITDTFCLNHGIHKLFRSFKVRHQRWIWQRLLPCHLFKNIMERF